MELAPFLQDGSGQLARRSVRATIATTVAAGLDFAVRLGSVAILARLVSPADFGVVMVAGAAVAIAEQFRDLGLSTATLQRPDLSAAEVTNLFWINFYRSNARSVFGEFRTSLVQNSSHGIQYLIAGYFCLS